MNNNAQPLKYVVVGSGWRSLFYWRIAQAYPDIFAMPAMLCRSAKKAEKMHSEYGVPAVTTVAECEAAKPDFVVVAVNKDSIFDVTSEWLGLGYPVVCETPAAMRLEDLDELWKLRTERGAKIQVAEQYLYYPSCAAGISAVRRGYLGDPYAVNISAAHDYHAVSLIRQFLNVGMEDAAIFGKKYSFPVEETGSRAGDVTDGNVKMSDRVRLTFEFENGKAAFYDFGGVQYHSHIRTRHVMVLGPHGELCDDVLRYTDAATHLPQMEKITLDSPKPYAGVRAAWLGDELVYSNPLCATSEGIMPLTSKETCCSSQGTAHGSGMLSLDAAHDASSPLVQPSKPTSVLLPQDETAIATILLGMRRYIDEGVEPYPLAEALQDAYFRILMEEALKSGQPVHSIKQTWSA